MLKLSVNRKMCRRIREVEKLGHFEDKFTYQITLDDNEHTETN